MPGGLNYGGPHGDPENGLKSSLGPKEGEGGRHRMVAAVSESKTLSRI